MNKRSPAKDVQVSVSGRGLAQNVNRRVRAA